MYIYNMYNTTYTHIYIYVYIYIYTDIDTISTLYQPTCRIYGTECIQVPFATASMRFLKTLVLVDDEFGGINLRSISIADYHDHYSQIVVSESQLTNDCNEGFAK